MFGHISIVIALVRFTMDSSETGVTEDTSVRETFDLRSQVRRDGTLSGKQMMRALLGLEAASFFLAATIHAGILLSGFEHREAMIAETVIGSVLLIGLVITRIRPRLIFSVGALVQAFALFGTLIGLWTIFVGIGPQTLLDIVYHAVMVTVLTAGIIFAWRSREP